MQIGDKKKKWNKLNMRREWRHITSINDAKNN